MAEDISKVTIMVLLVLTIIVSVLSTMIILDRSDQLTVRPTVQAPQDNKGYVGMTIAKAPDPDFKSGQVSINIAK